MRDAISSFIESTTPFGACCCQACDGVEAIEKARESIPALVILNLSTPMVNGIETASALRRTVPETKIIGLGMFDAEFRGTLRDAVGFDIDIVLSKRDGLGKLAEAINTLLSPDGE